MEDLATRYPAHDLGYKNDVWTCPKSGIEVPKSLLENLRFRKIIQEHAGRSEVHKADMMAACAASPHLFLNCFAWTYRPKFTCDDGRIRGANVSWVDKDGAEHKTPPPDAPVITWPAQDEMIDMLVRNFRQGGTLVIDKSREQGATVIIMYMIAWGMLFIDRFTCLVISRKSDMVDGPSEDSLFGKVDYLLNKLPDYFLPEDKRDRRRGNNPFIFNNVRGSRIMGETSNKDVGQSLRTNIIFVDEAARYPDGKALMKSIESVAAGVILASTPSGPGTEFSMLREKSLTPEGAEEISVCTLGYWDHPDMGQNRVLTLDDDGAITGKAGTHFWESPAFRVARARAPSIRDVRENWLIDHDTSGLLALDSNILSKMKLCCSLPKHTGDFDIKGMRFLKNPDGRLKIWCDLDKDGDPPWDDNYVQGADIAQGVDGSNTVLAVMSRTTGRVVAEYADPNIDPIDAAELAVALGRWFGGQYGYAFQIFERNGPGIAYGNHLVRSGYPFVYYRTQQGVRSQRKTKHWGWQSTGDTKEIMFSTLNRFMKNGWFITPSTEGVADMGMWIFDEQGRIISGKLRDQSTGAQQRHGDRCIAYGMCCIGVTEAPMFDTSKPKFKDGTFGKLAGHGTMSVAKVRDNDPFRRRRRR